MKKLLLLLQLLVLLLFRASAADQPVSPPGPPHVPTTKILAIGSIVTPLTAKQRSSIMPSEVAETLKLYLAGKIDQWWVRQDNRGVVFLMNSTSEQEARELLRQLPLGRAKLMEFDFLPLGPLSPLNLLLNGSNPAPQK